MSVIKISKKIVGWEVEQPKTSEELEMAKKEEERNEEIRFLEAEIAQLRNKIEEMSRHEIVTADRSKPLEAYSYKIDASPKDPNAYYVTITNIMHKGRKRVYEIFINTKNPKHHQWLTALTRLATAIMRREENPLFVGEELSEAFDIEGGGYYRKGGVWYKGLADEIGSILTQHIKEVIAYNESAENEDDNINIEEIEVETPFSEENFAGEDSANDDTSSEEVDPEEMELRKLHENAAYCPSCGKKSYLMQGGCGQCTNCAYSTCG
ncbi:MAG: hypothetical protein CUN56_00655 [Phototrophicales bacterium]|nr:MAG: hypothetical protein CUN56_00655 [Phototrophicales bacterium]